MMRKKLYPNNNKRPGIKMIKMQILKVITPGKMCPRRKWVWMGTANKRIEFSLWKKRIIFVFPIVPYFFFVLVKEVKERKVEKMKKLGWKLKGHKLDTNLNFKNFFKSTYSKIFLEYLPLK